MYGVVKVHGLVKGDEWHWQNSWRGPVHIVDFVRRPAAMKLKCHYFVNATSVYTL